MVKNSCAADRFIFVLTFILPLLPSCTHKSKIDRRNLYLPDEHYSKNNAPHANNLPAITIYIHGTLILRRPSYYKVFQEQSLLIAVKQLPQDHHFYKLAKTISDQNQTHFPFDDFYIFGWSGRLSDSERNRAAEKLYDSIENLIKQYEQQYGMCPTITVIAHSHGGNVALKMATIKKTQPFSVKSLVLLACPVQEKTMHLIGEPIFNRVYSLYSSMDIVQIIAPQLLHNSGIQTTKRKRCRYKFPPFSSRRFPHQHHLTQAKIKINGLAPSHTTFASQAFIGMLPTILFKLDDWHETLGHSPSIQKQKLLCIYTHRN